MEEMYNDTDGGDMYQHQDGLQSGDMPDELYGHSNRLILEEANGEGLYQQDAARDEGYRRGDRPMMGELQNGAEGVDSMYQQDALREGEIYDGGYGTGGQRLEQDVQRMLVEIMEETQLGDDEVGARMAAAEKELAEAEDHRIRNHEELVLLRQQLAELILQTKKEDEWNNAMEPMLDDAEESFQYLDHKCADLAKAHTKYVDEIDQLCKYSQLMSGIVEMARQDLETFKLQAQREIADLKLAREEEQAKTRTLLMENDNPDEYGDLQEESDEIDKEILDLEIKLDVEKNREAEILERVSSVKEEIAKEEEISKQLDEMEAQLKKMRQQREEKQAFLNAQLAKKDEIVRRAVVQKGRLEAVTERYNSLMQEKDEIKKKFEGSNVEKTNTEKELEEGVKELVVSQNKNATEIGDMLKKKTDLEECVRQKESKLQESRKSKEALEERVTSIEREISELNQDTIQKQGKTDSLKMSVTQLEDQLRNSAEALDKLRRSIEQKINEDAYAGLCHEDELFNELAKVQGLRCLLQESDNIIATLEFQRYLLQGEWDSLFEKIKSIREAFTSRSSTLDITESETGGVWLEEMRKTIQSEVQVLAEACSKAQCKRDELRSQIEELNAARKASEVAAGSMNQEKESLESTIQSLRSSLVAKQKMIEDVKLNIEDSNKIISSSKEMEAQLEKEIESILKRDVGDRKSVLMKQLEDIDKQIEIKRLSVEKLKSAYSEIDKKIMEEQERGEEVVKARQKEIAVLDKLGAEKEEEIRESTEKLKKWRAMIESNKEKRAARLKRSEEIQENLSTIEKEISSLEEKLGQLKKDAAAKEKQRKATLQELQTKITAIKKKGEDEDTAFVQEKKGLTEKIKAAQKNMKTILSEKAKPETNDENTMEAPSQDNVQSGNTFGVLTQRDPPQRLNRSKEVHHKRERSPSSDSPSSISSIELSADDMAAVRAGRLSIWQLAAKHSQESKMRKKSRSQ